MIGIFLLRIFLCNHIEEEKEIDHEDDGGPIYYDSEEQLKKIQFQTHNLNDQNKSNLTLIGNNDQDEQLKELISRASMTPVNT
jgi:hypothetical protein